MNLYITTVSLLLLFLAASAQDGQLASLAHANAIPMQLQRAMSVVNLKEFQSASTIAVLGGELTGYGLYSLYLDSSCTTFVSASVYPLNACVLDTGTGIRSNVKVTATSNTVTFATFSDDACTSALEAPKSISYTSECSAAKIKFLTQSSNQAPTTKATVSLR
jgi:hypothetical protein